MSSWARFAECSHGTEKTHIDTPILSARDIPTGSNNRQWLSTSLSMEKPLFFFFLTRWKLQPTGMNAAENCICFRPSRSGCLMNFNFDARFLLVNLSLLLAAFSNSSGHHE